MSNTLDYDERDVLKTILAVGGPDLGAHLEAWGEWLKDRQRADINRQVHPPYPIVLLSLMGIHGGDALK